MRRLALIFFAVVLHAKDVTVTAYCPCRKCCGEWAAVGRTAAGTRPVQGRTVAATKDFPLGQKIRLYGRTVIVEDRMHERYKKNRLDIFMNSHADAVKFGKRKVRI